jgi:uncharacterized membrane protein YdjX (TVP38/TMEM64 family)
MSEWLITIRDWLTSLGPWATPAFIGVYVFAAVLGIPSVLFMLVAGTLFGFRDGLIRASIADVLGAISCFMLGRTIIRTRVEYWIRKNPKLARLDQALAKKGWKILLLTRLSPIVPSNLLNYGFSLTRVRFWQFLITSWLGMIPVIALYVYIGSFGASLTQVQQSPQNLGLQAIGLVGTVLASLYVARLTQRALNGSKNS